jgi:hypothetical protein
MNFRKQICLFYSVAGLGFFLKGGPIAPHLAKSATTTFSEKILSVVYFSKMHVIDID